MSNRGDYGVSFSPINENMTEEELIAQLERLFAAGKPTISRLPRPKIRGGIDMFAGLLGRGGGVQRPSLAEVLAPQAPISAEDPAPPIGEEAVAPEVPEGPEEPAPAPGDEDLAPDWPVPDTGLTDPYGNPYLGSPGNVPSPGGPIGQPNPINPFSEYAPTAAPPATPEEEEEPFFRQLYGMQQ